MEQRKLPETEILHHEKWPIHQEDIDTLNVYVQSYNIKKKLIELKGYIDKSKFTVGDFKTLLPALAGLAQWQEHQA